MITSIMISGQAAAHFDHIINSDLKQRKVSNINEVMLDKDLRNSFDSVSHKGLLLWLLKIVLIRVIFDLLYNDVSHGIVQMKLNNEYMNFFSQAWGCSGGLSSDQCYEKFFTSGMLEDTFSITFKPAQDSENPKYSNCRNSLCHQVQKSLSAVQQWCAFYWIQIIEAKIVHQVRLRSRIHTR